MRFDLHLAGAAKPAFALVVAHGFTDLDSLAWVKPNAAAALLPIPTESVTALFCVASVYHFSEDFSVVGSLAVHGLVLIVGLASGVQSAFMAMLGYLALVHVPSHYLRCAFRGRGRAAKCALVAGAKAATLSVLVPDVDVVFGDEVQRLVVAHIFVEAQKN